MTATREAFYLPLMFLTVTLLGGVRVADRVSLIPPPLFALVLAALLLGVLVKGRALVPERLMRADRAPLANLNGLVVLLTTFVAAAQAFNVAIPESGLPRMFCQVLLLVLLLNTLVASPDRVRVLRSLMVIFGSAFTLKFVVLTAISSPAESGLKRVLLAMLEGLTLGTLTQSVVKPITGYIAFAVLVLFLTGLALLPGRPPDASQLSVSTSRRDLIHS
jgi:hypothetical protein